MLILDLLGMYFDAAVVFVMNSSLFFRLAVAILCNKYESCFFQTPDQIMLMQGCRPWGCRSCHGTLRFWQISTSYLKWGGTVL